jgi:hypothetical protein
MDRKYKEALLDAFWTGVAVNNDCMEIFRRAEDTNIINRGIYWMEQLFKSSFKSVLDVDYIDTYANLLYKAGKMDEAIYWEDKALKLSENAKDYVDVYNKMKQGLKTWPQN